MVTKREALEELRLQDLQKVADRLGVRASKGVAGVLTKAMFGSTPESRRSYIDALANSDVVTLESIDRILHTRYSRLPDDTRGVRGHSEQRGILSGILSARQTEANRFYTLDSLFQHILNEYVTKTDLQKICSDLGVSATGNKGDIACRILSDPRLTSYMALHHVNRNNMRKLSEDMRLPAVGTRKEMESRILGAMTRLPRAPKSNPVHNPQYSPPQITQTYHVAPETPYIHAPRTPSSYVASQGFNPDESASSSEVSSEVTMPRYPEHKDSASPAPSAPETLSVPTIAISPEFDDVVRFIDEWRPTKPYKDEVGYEVELDTRLRTRYGDACVKNQLHILDGRIDIEVMGIGVELKVPTNKAMLQRLVGQTMMYRKHYGPNLLVVIITGRAKLQDVLAFKSDLEMAGTTVVVKSG